jgi:hypothetical protein
VFKGFTGKTYWDRTYCGLNLSGQNLSGQNILADITYGQTKHIGGTKPISGKNLSVEKPIGGLYLTADRKPFRRTNPIVRTKKSTV